MSNNTTAEFFASQQEALDRLAHLHLSIRREWQQLAQWMEDDHQRMKSRVWEYIHNGSLIDMQNRANDIVRVRIVQMHDEFDTVKGQLMKDVMAMMNDHHQMQLIAAQVNQTNLSVQQSHQMYFGILFLWMLVLSISRFYK